MTHSRLKKLMGAVFLSFFLIVSSSCETPPPKTIKCTDTIGCVDIVPGAPLKIGILQALSGKVAPLGIEQIRGFELALEKRQGALLGHKVEYSTDDTGCSPEGGANVALKIIADPQYVAVFGTTCSAAAAASSKALSAAGLTMISGNNSAPFLTSIAGKRALNWQAGYFRTAFNEEHSGKAAAIYAYKYLHLRKAATINDGDIYTRGLTDGFSQTFQELGGEVVLDTSIDKGDTVMQPVLQSVVNSTAELLFFPLFQPEGNLILMQAGQIDGLQNVVLMSDGALIEQSFIENVKEKGHGMYFVGPANPTGSDVDTLGGKYTERFGAAPSTNYYLNAFDAANLLFDALENSAVTRPDGSLLIGRQALRDALYSTKGYQGMTGTLNCDAFGDCASPAFNILRLDDHTAGIDGLVSNILFTYSP